MNTIMMMGYRNALKVAQRVHSFIRTIRKGAKKAIKMAKKALKRTFKAVKKAYKTFKKKFVVVYKVLKAIATIISILYTIYCLYNAFVDAAGIADFLMKVLEILF